MASLLRSTFLPTVGREVPSVPFAPDSGDVGASFLSTEKLSRGKATPPSPQFATQYSSPNLDARPEVFPSSMLTLIFVRERSERVHYPVDQDC